MTAGKAVRFVVALALLALAAAAPAFAQDPATLHLAPEARAHLAAAADAPGLAPWQRALMRDPAGDASSAAATAADGAWTPLAAVARRGHTAVLDPVRQRVLVFGGENAGLHADVWALALTGTPAWTRLAVAGTPPSPRSRHAAAYDAARDRMLVFGGDDGNRRNDVWALALAGTPEWTEIVPAGTPPSPRAAASVVVDVARDRAIVFGGDDGAPLGDAWALSLAGTPAWTPLAPAGTPPVARQGAGAVLDAARDRMLVFGGWDGSELGDTWALSLAGGTEWHVVSPDASGPAGRHDGVTVFDTARDRLVIFGGSSDAGPAQDAWALSLADSQWTSLSPVVTPITPRVALVGVYDSAHAALLVHGGDDGSIAGDTWSLALAGDPAWSAFAPQPPARAYASVVLDPVRHRLVVFGGLQGETRLADTWALSLGATPAWTQLQPLGAPPSARYRHTAIYDPVRDRMLVFGGWDGAYRNDVRALQFSGTLLWAAVTPTGTPPSARMGHTAIYDPVRDRMLVFGGFGGTLLNDTWALSLAGTPAWSAVNAGGTLPGMREAHAVFYDAPRDRMVIVGGYGTLVSDDWALSLAGTPAWSALAAGPGPNDMRFDFAGAYDAARGTYVLFGGTDLIGQWYHDTWTLAPAPPPAWTPLAPAGAPPGARAGHAGAFDAASDRLLVFGGLTLEAGWSSEVWALDRTAAGAVPPPAATGVALAPPAPNPFAVSTAVRFTLSHTAHVRLDVLDFAGRRVRTLVDGEREAGPNAAAWDGRDDAGHDLPPAVYLLRFAVAGHTESRRIVRIR